MKDVSGTLDWVCCFCGKPADRKAKHTVDIIVDLGSAKGTQHVLAHPACLVKQLHPDVPTLIDLDAETK